MYRHILTGFLLFLTASAYAQDDRTDRERQLVDLYRDVIAYRSARGHDQVRPLAKYLEARFLSGGFGEQDVRYLQMGDENAALVVRYRGRKSSVVKPVLFMAHMDIVDALPADWQRDPYALIEEDGYFYGRGTGDNKAGVVLLTSTFIRLREEGFVPNRDMIIALTGDEETDAEAISSLVTEHRHLVDAEFALNSDAGHGGMDADGNPLGMQMQMAEKNYMTFDLTVKNRGGHSSAPRADNAIYELAAALKNLEAFHWPVKLNDITKLQFELQSKMAAPGDKIATAMGRFAANPHDAEAAEILRNSGAMGQTRTTCVATMLTAGHAENALPQTANATVNCRVFPGESVAETTAMLDQAVADETVAVVVRGNPTAGPASPVRDDVMDLVREAIDSQYPGLPVMPMMAAYATDGKFTRAAGIPTYGVGALLYGPDDFRAHGLNERVYSRSFFKASGYWYYLMTKL
jgi:acetylornithine deacetylase/succinyl-diaminopimelate desuccinylase-like protein|tara:strand:- start:12512 stop:13900 length:1389 start_codon:yes stop_codon:yes gene_type:complete